MYLIHYDGQAYECKKDETILEAFIRQGKEIPFSCRKGNCKSCKTKVVRGTIPNNASGDLAPHLVQNRIILPCITFPKSDMMLTSPSYHDLMRPLYESPYEFKTETDSDHPEPDLELWSALKNGELLLHILTDFYTKVYQDDKLAPFFESTSIDRAIGKQYNFLQQIFTGEKVFFGFYPRTAHHWMIIDDALFDYRNDLLEASMKAFDLPEEFRKRWRSIDEHYRPMIVKSRKWPKIIGDVVVPVGSFEVITAEMDMVCDGCMKEIPMGSQVRYHTDEARAYCTDCALLSDQ